MQPQEATLKDKALEKHKKFEWYILDLSKDHPKEDENIAQGQLD